MSVEKSFEAKAENNERKNIGYIRQVRTPLFIKACKCGI